MSNKTIYYRQCHLVRKAPPGEFHQTSWIPEQFAVLGKALKLRQDAEWVDGWMVTSVGDARLPEEQLPDPLQEIKSHRRATGDSMKKEKHP
jgi:hypothetical protein